MARHGMAWPHGLRAPGPVGSILPLPQGCPGGSVPFRAMQCSLYDDKPIPGTQARYRWVPFYGGEPRGSGCSRDWGGTLLPPPPQRPLLPFWPRQPPTPATSTAWPWGTISTTPSAGCWTAPAAAPTPRSCASAGAAWWVCEGTGPPGPPGTPWGPPGLLVPALTPPLGSSERRLRRDPGLGCAAPRLRPVRRRPGRVPRGAPALPGHGAPLR